MGQRTFDVVAEAVFLAVALLHAMRLYRRWEVNIGGKAIPLVVSWVGLLVAGYLAYAAHALRAN